MVGHMPKGSVSTRLHADKNNIICLNCVITAVPIYLLSGGVSPATSQRQRLEHISIPRSSATEPPTRRLIKISSSHLSKKVLAYNSAPPAKFKLIVTLRRRQYDDVDHRQSDSEECTVATLWNCPRLAPRSTQEPPQGRCPQARNGYVQGTTLLVSFFFSEEFFFFPSCCFAFGVAYLAQGATENDDDDDDELHDQDQEDDDDEDKEDHDKDHDDPKHEDHYHKHAGHHEHKRYLPYHHRHQHQDDN